MPRASDDHNILDRHIEHTALPNRARRWLQAAGIVTVRQLTERTEADLLTLRNFAETSLNHVKQFLAEHDLKLSPPREQQCEKDWVVAALDDPEARLTNRESQILKLRHGIDHPRPLTLEETGQHFDLTRERVRQIQKKAEEKVIAHVTFSTV